MVINTHPKVNKETMHPRIETLLESVYCVHYTVLKLILHIEAIISARPRGLFYTSLYIHRLRIVSCVYITIFYQSCVFLNVSINRQPIIYFVSISFIPSSIDFVTAVQCLFVVIKLTGNCFVLWGHYVVQIFCSIFLMRPVVSLMGDIGI